MYLQADLDSIRRMLGVAEDEIPIEVTYEYRVRLRMFHANGHSGPMGTAMLIDMLRSMKLGPKPPSAAAAITDWSRVPADGSVRIEARVPSKEDPEKCDWRPGTFCGRVGAGTLAIRLDGDTYIHEFRGADVRVATVQDDPKPPPKHSPIRSPKVPVNPIPAVSENPPGERKASDIMNYAENLSTAPLGSKIWVEDADMDIKDAVFHGMQGDRVLAIVDGEELPRSFHVNSVTYTG